MFICLFITLLHYYMFVIMFVLVSDCCDYFMYVDLLFVGDERRPRGTCIASAS